MTNSTALLVIDVQVGVMADCHDAAGVIGRISALVEQARSAGVPVVWVQHNDEELERDSADWQIVPELAPLEGELRVFKTFSDSFSGTELAAGLERLGVNRLVVCGAQSDFCIRNTWHSALLRGYDAVLVSDAHTTVDSAWDETPLPAETVIAYTNMYASWGSSYPEASGSAVAAADISFA